MAASECMHDGLPLLKGGIFRESAFLQKHCGAVEGKAYAFRRVCIGADGDKAASEIMIFLQIIIIPPSAIFENAFDGIVKSKSPARFAVQMGSVVETVTAKVCIFF